MLVSSEVSFGPGILQTSSNVASENWKTGFLPHVSKNRNSFDFFPNKEEEEKKTLTLSVFGPPALLHQVMINHIGHHFHIFYGARSVAHAKFSAENDYHHKKALWSENLRLHGAFMWRLTSGFSNNPFWPSK